MQYRRFGASGRALLRAVSLSSAAGASTALRRKASGVWCAVRHTYLSTKDVFESHRVVFTIGTSVASFLTAWAGYSMRHLHESRVEKRLDKIEESLKSTYEAEHKEIKHIVNSAVSGNVSMTTFVATGCTSLIVGYFLGWRGGAWNANRKFQKEQLKAMGQVKPPRWRFLQKPLIQLRNRNHSKKPSSEEGLKAINTPEANVEA